MAKAKKKIFDIMDSISSPRFLTGFTQLDFYCGKDQVLDKNNMEEFIKVRGITAGASINIMGRSNSGKSLLALNIGGNLVRPYENSMLHIYSSEGDTDMGRVSPVTGIAFGDLHKKVRKIDRSEASLEHWYSYVCDIIDDKVSNPDKYTIMVKCPDGKDRPILCPTVIVTDSISTLRSEDDKGKSNITNMDGARSAGAKGRYLEKARDNCGPANVILINIQQEYKNISTNGMPNVRDQRGFSGNLSANGGDKLKFEASLTLRFANYVAPNSETAMKKFNCDENIDAMINVVIAKSRFGESSDKTQFTIVQTRLQGFDRKLSLIYDMINRFDGIFTKPSNGRYQLKGTDSGLYLKDVIRKFDEDPEYRRLMGIALNEYFHDKILYYDTDDVMKKTTDLLNELI